MIYKFMGSSKGDPQYLSAYMSKCLLPVNCTKIGIATL